jgi:mannose-6-phosphate isomerase-like protein (cupin superfamily)/catechol 2,3-dioxygenase-like lactoylglutathione lyase family enzyme
VGVAPRVTAKGADEMTEMVITKRLSPEGRPSWSDVTGAGMFSVRPGDHVDRHYHDCDEYWLVFAGRAVVAVGDETFTIEAGDIVCTPAGVEHVVVSVAGTLAAFYFEGRTPEGGRVGHLHRNAEAASGQVVQQLAMEESVECGIHHAAVKATDWDASTRLYEALGFPAKMTWGSPGQRIAFLAARDGSCIEMFETTEPFPDDAELNFHEAIPHICIRTDDVDASCEVARALGMKVLWEPRDSGTGDEALTPRICFFEGPAGEVIELIQGMPDWSEPDQGTRDRMA